MRAIIRNILKELQVESIREAQDGTDALALLKDVPFDMIITDWNMKPMNGLQFVRSIRLSKDTPNRYIPIIMVTAFTELGQVVTQALPNFWQSRFPLDPCFHGSRR